MTFSLRSSGGSRGVSLVETVLGLTIFLLVALTALNLLPSSWLGAHSGEQHLCASNMAQSILDEKRASNFDNLSTGDFPAVQLYGTEYRPHLDVASDSSKPYLKVLTLKIEWDLPRGKQTLTRKISLCKLPR